MQTLGWQWKEKSVSFTEDSPPCPIYKLGLCRGCAPFPDTPLLMLSDSRAQPWESSPLLLAVGYITLSGINSLSDVYCCALLLHSLHYLACWQQILPMVIANCLPEIWDRNRPSNSLYRTLLRASSLHHHFPLTNPFVGLWISLFLISLTHALLILYGTNFLIKMLCSKKSNTVQKSK